jgi:rhomboid protease GluP
MDSPHLGTEVPFPVMHTFVKENWLTRKPAASAGIVMALVTLFLVLGSLCYWMDLPWGASSWMAASKSLVFEKHQYWRAWTTLLVHADGKHLLGNASLFFVLGAFLTGYFGVFLVPFSGFLLGGVVNLLVLSGMPAETQLIGVSGVVFWMGGAWLALYFLIETRRSVNQRALRALGVGLVLFMPAEAFDPSISYKCHFWGFVFGLAWGGLYYLIKKRPLREAEVRETTIEEAGGEDEFENSF